MVIEARTTFGSPIFRELVITTYWIVWKTRNGVVFDNEVCNLRIGRTDSKRRLDWFVSKASKT